MFEHYPNLADISDLFREQMAVRAIEALPMIIAYWGRDERCYFANHRYKEWFGRSADEMNGITLSELLGPLYSLNEPYIRHALQGETQVFERDITTPSGEIRHSIATYIPDVVNGEVVGFFAHVADISKFKDLEKQWERTAHEAKQDSLTGLLNRRAFDERFQGLIEAAHIDKSHLSILLIDVDCFKKINDSYGHNAGDAVLQAIAQRLVTALRETDLIARWGGDEYSIVLRHYRSKEDVLNLVPRIRNITSKDIPYENQTLRTTVSMGVAFFPEDGTTSSSLFACADSRLYDDKRQHKTNPVLSSIKQLNSQ